MQFLNELVTKYSKFQVIFKSFFLIIILFLVFYAVNLFFIVKNKPQSAYTVLENLSEKEKLKLQDTRVHNWSEIKTKNEK